MPNPVKTGPAALTARPTLVPLTSLALIEVSGADAQPFLQGQLSNDIDAIGAGEARVRPCQLNAYCNPKGRMLALIRLARWAGGFRMMVSAGLADGLVKRLKMYVLRARVEIALKPEIVMLGRIGMGADDDAPTGAGDDAGDAIERLTLDGIVPRQILLGEKQAMDAFADTFVDAGGHNAETNDDLWRLTDILSGIPQVYPQTVEVFIPQMLNLDLVGGLSFTKGCYPGQEIVARLRYLGKVKQRMLAGTVSGVKNLGPGDPIHTEQRPEQKAGVVVDAVETGNGEYTFSATAPATMIEHGTLRTGSASGPALSRIALPYQAPME